MLLGLVGISGWSPETIGTGCYGDSLLDVWFCTPYVRARLRPYRRTPVRSSILKPLFHGIPTTLAGPGATGGLVTPGTDRPDTAMPRRQPSSSPICKYVALSRADHESNSIAFSDTLEHWENRQTVQVPRRPWEIIQLGNCGSPIETEIGWLVLTHAVGPMRTYYISAMLLDLEDPTKVIASLDEPLLSPTGEARHGYVPNVVYSCGSLRVNDMLMLPFGIADQSIGIATARISALIESLMTKARVAATWT